MKTTNNETVISEEIALNELMNFVNHYSLVPKDEAEIKEDLNIALLAIQQGLLIIKDNVPMYKLKHPILTDGGDVHLETIEFKTRIKPSEHSRLFAGLDLKKEAFEYSLKCLAFLINQPKAMLDKLSKFDYTATQQIATVFM